MRPNNNSVTLYYCYGFIDRLQAAWNSMWLHRIHLNNDQGISTQQPFLIVSWFPIAIVMQLMNNIIFPILLCLQAQSIGYIQQISSSLFCFKFDNKVLMIIAFMLLVQFCPSSGPEHLCFTLMLFYENAQNSQLFQFCTIKTNSSAAISHVRLKM